MNTRPYRPPKEVREIAQRLAQAGWKAYVVGGSLRDHVLGRDSGSDVDMASNARAEDIMKLFGRVIPTGIKHGTVTILGPTISVEITTFRSEHAYSDGRRPESVEYLDDIHADLGRRDFTMNAMAFDPLSGALIDPYDGRLDIGRRLIRTVGDPLLRFSEDGLRPMRAIRFASQLGFSIDEATLRSIPLTLDTFKKVSKERLRDELDKILVSEKPSAGLRLLESTGLLAQMIPELLACRNCSQRGAHVFDVLDHLYASVDAAPADISLRLAALFHDIGKPAAKVERNGDEPTFHRHEQIAAAMSVDILKRLKYPNETVDRVKHLIQHHMFNYQDEWSDAAVRRFVAAVGQENLEDLFLLRSADTAGTGGRPADSRGLDPLRGRIKTLLTKDSALKIKDLRINGEDLASLGIPRGPAMGRILTELLETVLDDPGQNEKETLLKIARGIRGKYGLH